MNATFFEMIPCYRKNFQKIMFRAFVSPSFVSIFFFQIRKISLKLVAMAYIVPLMIFNINQSTALPVEMKISFSCFAIYVTSVKKIIFLKTALGFTRTTICIFLKGR